MIAQHLRGWRAAFAHDGGQHQCTADGAALALLRSHRGRLADMDQITAEGRLARLFADDAIFEAREIIGNLRDQARDIDVAGFENDGGVAILREREQ